MDIEMKQYPPSEEEYGYGGGPGHQYPIPQGNVGYMPATKAPSRPVGANKEDERLQCYKYLLFSFNLVLFLCGCVLLGIGIWMAVDRNFMTYIIGNDLYAVAIYFILVAGALIFFVSFLGCCGSITENKCMVFVFLIFLCVIFLLCFVGGILAIVFRTQIGDSVRDTMTTTLKEHYGVEFQYRFNRLVTDSWDKAQERLKCCGVESNSWQAYRESKWFEQYGATNEVRGQTYSHERQKPYVPRSCCVKDRFWRYINLEVCQKWRLGPPGSPVDGAINRALYYEGCYDAGQRYLYENSVSLIVLGIVVAFMLVGGIVLSILLIRRIPDMEEQ